MIAEVTFYGGPHHLQTYPLKATPPSIRIETEEILGFYHLHEGIAGFEYRWTRPRGRWTEADQKKLDRAFPKE